MKITAIEAGKLELCTLQFSLVSICQHILGIFTPQPSGLEGYCHTGLAALLLDFVECISCVQHHGHLPNCPIWACPCAKNLSNLLPVQSRLCEMHISATAGHIYFIQSSMVNCLGLKLWSIMVICLFAPYGVQTLQNAYPKPLGRFTPSKVLWKCLDM